MAEPTAAEVLMLAMINRARLDPSGEGARYGISLNEGLAPGTLSTVSRQPLAFSGELIASARGHSQAMIDRDFFAHNDPLTGSTPQSRATAAGYAGSVGENIAFRGPDNGVATLLTQHQDLFVDSGIAGRGHRLNILDERRLRRHGLCQLWGGFRRWVQLDGRRKQRTVVCRRLQRRRSDRHLPHQSRCFRG